MTAPAKPPGVETLEPQTVPDPSDSETKEGTSEIPEISPENLVVSQDFDSMIAVKKKLITVPVRKPDRQSFVRVHPDDSYSLMTAVLELKDERETYLVDKPLWELIPQELSHRVLLTTITRQGVLSLWPIVLPGSDGRQLDWHKSALEAAQLAKKNWVRLLANMSLKAYEVYVASDNIPEPEWPEESFADLLKIAFKDRWIYDYDHPVLKRLRGSA